MNKISFIINAMICSAIVSLIVCLSIWVVRQVRAAPETTYTEIYSVDMRDNYHGIFVLGSGHVDNNVYYYVYQATEDGGKKLNRYNSNNVTIYETLESGEQPYIEIIEKMTAIHVKMYLPENSIIEEYDVNLAE